MIALARMMARNSWLNASASWAVNATVRVAARANGQRLEVGGPEAARRFGLTTQVPMQTTFLTSGRSRIVAAGRRSVRLEHVSDTYLAHAGTPAGAALSALRHVGRDGLTPEVVERVLGRLDARNRRRLMRSARHLPPTLARALRTCASRCCWSSVAG